MTDLKPYCKHVYEKEDTMTTEELNKRFAELCKIEWHEGKPKREGACICGKSWIRRSSLQLHLKANPNPDFVADPRLVLRELDRLGLMDEFVVKRYLHQHPIMFAHDMVDDFVFGAGMIRAAIEFMEGRDETTKTPA